MPPLTYPNAHLLTEKRLNEQLAERERNLGHINTIFNRINSPQSARIPHGSGWTEDGFDDDDGAAGAGEASALLLLL